MNELKKQCVSIPNLISFLRIILIYPFVRLFLQQEYISSILILLISGLSDLLDGFIARKFNQVTSLGKILDPIADKLTLVAVVICISIKFPPVMPIALLLIIKDLSMLVGGLFLIRKGIDPPCAQWYGKLATVAFYTSVLTIILLNVLFSLENLAILFILLSVAAIFMIFALVKYFILFLNLLKNK